MACNAEGSPANHIAGTQHAAWPPAIEFMIVNHSYRGPIVDDVPDQANVRRIMKIDDIRAGLPDQAFD
jgi:hypothetical protein